MKTVAPFGSAMHRRKRPLIGLFDSGVGGLSVLKALHDMLPSADYLYIADSHYAPYGEKSDDFIEHRTHRVASHMLAQGASMLVVACNTASAIAAQSLRQRWPRLAIVAVEPGVKPATEITVNGRIGVMATPATLRSDKFKHLVERHGRDVYVLAQPCPGLAGAIEHGDSPDHPIDALIARLTAPLIKEGVDTVVLGCTHYSFVQQHIQSALGSKVSLIDTADAVARQSVGLLGFRSVGCGQTWLQTTGDLERLVRFAKLWLPFECGISAAIGL